MNADEREKLEIQNLKYLSSFYASEAQRLENVLRIIGITKSELRDTSIQNFEFLVKIGQMFKLDRINTPNLLSAMNDLHTETFNLREQKQDLNKKIRIMNEYLKKFNLTQDKLNRDVTQLLSKVEENKNDAIELEQQTQKLKKRLKIYEERIEENQKALTNLRPSLKHENLEQEYREMIELEAKMNKLKEEFDAYEGIPVNEALAVLKIQEIKHELERLNEEIGSVVTH